MIKFYCAHCGQKVSALDSDGGKQAKCPKCQKDLTVPGSVDDAVKRACNEAEEWRRNAIEKSKLEEAEKRRRDQDVALKQFEAQYPATVASIREMRNLTDGLRGVLLAGSGQASRRSDCDISASKLAMKFILHDTYREQHSDILDDVENPAKAISELFLFHGWATQFAIRTFSSNPEKSDALVSEFVYVSDTLGQLSLVASHGVVFKDISASLADQLKHVKVSYNAPADFGSTLSSRWQEYDKIYLDCHGKYEEFAQSAICEAVVKHCGKDDPISRMRLTIWYLNRLWEVQCDAIEGGLW